MDAVPWLSLTAASGGWTLFGLAGFSVLTGWLTPRWVVSMMQKRIDALEAENRILLEQNATLLREGLPLSNAVMTAVKDAAAASKDETS